VHLARAALFNTPESRNESVFSSPCGDYWLAANARLDNRETLINTLNKDTNNSRFLTPVPDGQLILEAYMRWGKDCLTHLLGDFAFILWDATKRAFFCARDPMGIKSLFFASTPAGETLISNDHTALLKASQIPRKLDHAWLVQQVLPGFQSGFLSPIESIQKLEPGHCAFIHEKGARTERYWEIPHLKLDQMDEQTYLAELYKRLETAVARRLISDYPIASELSEGLDSSAISALSARLKTPDTVYTFSYQSEKETEENQHIWGETYRDIKAQLAMYPNLRPVWKETSEGPFTASPCTIEDLTMQSGFLQPDLLREKKIRTLLSGWGGDHCVTSYGDHYEDELFLHGRLFQLHKLMVQKRSRGRGITPWKGWLSLTAKHLWPSLYRKRVILRRGLTGQFHRQLRRHPLNYRALKVSDAYKRVLASIRNYEKSSVRQRDHRELFEITPEKRLAQSELAARNARVEYRYPMLDTELVTWAYHAPPHLKIKNGVERYMFREIMQGILTERNRTRRKADVSHPNREMEQRALQKRDALLAELKSDYNPQLEAFMPLETTLAFYRDGHPVAAIRALECMNAINRQLNSGDIKLEPNA
jgi:asparagine synthase (glutamine-hydrolysing)